MHVAQRLATQLDRCDLLVMTASNRRRRPPRLPGHPRRASDRARCARKVRRRPSTRSGDCASHGEHLGRNGLMATPRVDGSRHHFSAVSPPQSSERARRRSCSSGRLATLPGGILPQSSSPAGPAQDRTRCLAWSPQWADDLGAEFWLESVFHPLDLHMAANPHAEFEPALALLGSDVDVQLLPIPMPTTRQERSSRALVTFPRRCSP